MSEKPIPEAQLLPVYSMTNPRKLLGFDVRVDGRTVAVVSVNDVIHAGMITTAFPPEPRQPPPSWLEETSPAHTCGLPWTTAKPMGLGEPPCPACPQALSSFETNSTAPPPSPSRSK